MSGSRILRHVFLILILCSLVLWIQITVSAQTTDEQLNLGSQIFANNCVVCHGPTGEGRVGASLSKNWPSIRPDLTIQAIIENGVSGTVMPAWSDAKGGPLSDDEIDALVTYILSWQTGGRPEVFDVPLPTRRPPITPIPEIEGDPNRGGLLYDENCVVCHGVEGEGRIGTTLTKAWASIRPDLTIKSTIQRGVPGSQMPAWGQANGGPLSEQDIDDIVSFVLSRSDYSSSQSESSVIPPSPTQIPWLRGWGGIILIIGLLVVILSAAVLFQKRKSS